MELYDSFCFNVLIHISTLESNHLYDCIGWTLKFIPDVHFAINLDILSQGRNS